MLTLLILYLNITLISSVVNIYRVMQSDGLYLIYVGTMADSINQQIMPLDDCYCKGLLLTQLYLMKEYTMECLILGPMLSLPIILIFIGGILMDELFN